MYGVYRTIFGMPRHMSGWLMQDGSRMELPREVAAGLAYGMTVGMNRNGVRYHYEARRVS